MEILTLKKWLFSLCWLASAPVLAAQYVVCDPYPPTAAQPTEFVIAIVGQTTPVIVSATTGTEGAFMKWDVSSLVGTKTITVKARNAWGESAATPPFVFNAGVPNTPGNIRLISQ